MPTTGRFTSEDPILSGLNWYTYAGNNPVMYIDPFGLREVIVVIGEDRASNHNAFLNNANTFKKDNPDDTVHTLNALNYDSSEDLMNAIIKKSKDLGGVDALIIESHGTTSSLIVSGRYSLNKASEWEKISFNDKANIRFSGCNTSGYNGK